MQTARNTLSRHDSPVRRAKLNTLLNNAETKLRKAGLWEESKPNKRVDTDSTADPAFIAERDAVPLEYVKFTAADLEKAVGKIDGVNLAFEDYTESEVELVNIEALNKGQGRGTAAMEKIVAEADRHGVDLMRIPTGEPESDKRERLEEFYGRFGFENDGEVMRRRPVPSSMPATMRFALGRVSTALRTDCPLNHKMSGIFISL